MNDTVEIVCCHAEGEVGDVIVGGVPAPPGNSIWEQSRWIAGDNTLRNYVLNEPRGGVYRHVNLLVPAINPKAQMGFISKKLIYIILFVLLIIFAIAIILPQVKKILS